MIDALLMGEVDPRGRPTTYWFEYGPTSAYGAFAPRAKNGVVRSGMEVVSVQESVPVEEGEEYHYRLVARNNRGDYEGIDRTFVAQDLEALSILPNPGAEAATPMRYMNRYAMPTVDLGEARSSDWAARGTHSWRLTDNDLQGNRVALLYADEAAGANWPDTLVPIEAGWHYIRYHQNLVSYTNLHDMGFEGDFYSDSGGGSWLGGSYGQIGFRADPTPKYTWRGFPLGEQMVEAWMEVPATTVAFDFYMTARAEVLGPVGAVDVYFDSLIMIPVEGEGVRP